MARELLVIELEPIAYREVIKCISFGERHTRRAVVSDHNGRRGMSIQQINASGDISETFFCVKQETGFGRFGVITSIHGDHFCIDGIGIDRGATGMVLVFRGPHGVLRKGHAIVSGASPDGQIVRLREWLTKSVPTVAVGDSVEIRSSMEDGR
jgi:hypothetical protein